MAACSLLLLLFSSAVALSTEDGANINSLAREGTASKPGGLAIQVDQEGGVKGRVSGVENIPFNFTVALEGEQEELEVFWESSGTYVKPEGGGRQSLVFTRGDATNQTVFLESSLIGVFTLRFYSLEAKEKVWASEPLELVIKRSEKSEEGTKILTATVFVLLGAALCFMGLEIDLNVVLSTLKVMLICLSGYNQICFVLFLIILLLASFLTSCSPAPPWSCDWVSVSVPADARVCLPAWLAVPGDQLRAPRPPAPWQLTGRGQLKLLGQPFSNNYI